MMKLDLKNRYGCAIYKRLIPFIDAVEATPEKHFTFTSEGYDPLSIENLEYSFNGCPVYGMMHFYKQNGDVMRDPDITFFLDRETGCIIPMTYEQSALCVYQEVFGERPELVNHSRLRDLLGFMNTWAKNIVAQGFNPKQAAGQKPDTDGISLEKFSETYCQ